MPKKKIVVTGAAGHVSGILLPAFRERYELVLLDVTNKSKSGVIDDVVIADTKVELVTRDSDGATRVVRRFTTPTVTVRRASGWKIAAVRAQVVAEPK